LWIARAELLPAELIVEAMLRVTVARCANGRRRSHRVHSRYTRKIADRPHGARWVTVHLVVRPFRVG